MATPNPSKKSVSDIKISLLKPALTSHFEVYIKPPSNPDESGGAQTFFSANNAPYSNVRDLILLCSDATLPGSSLMTHESNNDFHGATERFAYRRLYDDRIDLTFYVNATNYYTIRFFETWIKYVSGEQIAKGVEDPFYSYRFTYPDGGGGYRQGSALSVTKFERDYRQRLIYKFIKPYPISIQSMPVSYDSSSLLKCTVSMTYIRYVLTPNDALKEQKEKTDPSGQSTANGVPRSPFDITPERQAQLNSAFTQDFNLGNLSAGTLTNTNFNPPNLF
jgi:hypothetical protein